jgi:hypothetical protein
MIAALCLREQRVLVRQGSGAGPRHSFVSITSDNGVPIETIADLVGHAGTAVTEKVYRHQLKPVITKGAETMNTIFKTKTKTQARSACGWLPLWLPIWLPLTTQDRKGLRIKIRNPL